MNASQIINEEMTLEQKLEAIDNALKETQEKADQEDSSGGQSNAPVDPQDLLMCEGCQ